MIETGGWCAPSETIYGVDMMWFVEVEPERWPAGLTSDDLDWIAEMLHSVEIDVSAMHYLDLPTLSIQRGGLRWDLP